jgi:putative spermidine/putrescine transport system substrate-binding protein
MEHLDRRTVLKGVAATAAAGAVGFPNIAQAQAKPYAGQTLTVFTYAGANEATLRKHLVPAFEQRTGARVVLDPGWWDMLPKLKASPPGQPVYDLVMTDPTQGLPAIKEGLFQQVNLDNIPNAKLSPTRLQQDWYHANAWGVNSAGSMMVMAFHTEAVPKMPAHWHELLGPDFKGKIGMYNAPYQSLFAFAQIKAGQAGRPGQGYEELKRDLDGVLKYSADNRDLVRLWWTSTGDFMGKLLQKELVGGVVAHSGPVPVEAEGKPVRTISPEEGTACVQVFWSIPKGTQAKRLAEEFINDFFSTDFQVKWGTLGKLTVVNLKAAELAGKQEKLYPRFLPTSPAAWDRVRFYPYDIYFDGNNWAKINDFWDREVLRKKRT